MSADTDIILPRHKDRRSRADGEENKLATDTRRLTQTKKYYFTGDGTE
ncbi:MAG: hypothetical protein U9R17_01565 [Thermodesulfobacteriota bacterium]|nr:hypothetical protein [Thermodesulfobacteriota bacterium]